MAATAPARRAVLVTRPEPGLSETCAHLAARGFEPVPAALLTIEHRARGRALPVSPQAVLVTSAHALAGLDPADVPMLFAVGDATASKARALGIAAVRSAGGDQVALLALCRARLAADDGPLLLVCGEGQGARLASDLRGAGFRVIRRVVYVQRSAGALPPAAREAIEQDRLVAALFMSGSAAHALARLLPAGLRPRLASIDALAISDGAARPLAALPWRSVRVALRPTAEDVLALL